TNLYELLSEILTKTSIPRIRLASVEPWDLPDNFFELFKDKRLMPHMHLPLQSGSDSVLRRMARRCKTEEFSTIVEKARSTIPFFNITTDIIVGFPGETDEEWNETLQFVEQTGFGHIHVFSYSQREGTKAARLPDQLDNSFKKERSRQMHELADKLKIQSLKALLGEKCDVLWERCINAESAEWVGYTPHYHKIISCNPEMKDSGISEVTVKSLSQENNSLLAAGADLEKANQFSVEFNSGIDNTNV
ncbi:MAG: radical SAM protein, partial [Gammaproteobacteria bacterium]|nr:radical SAM protein [Gammaproteobacteria bacterium]